MPRALLLVGPRGMGKTTFLLHMPKTRGCVFADNPTLAGTALYETVKTIFQAGYKGVIIDEVHFARDWSRHVKALYDDSDTASGSAIHRLSSCAMVSATSPTLCPNQHAAPLLREFSGNRLGILFRCLSGGKKLPVAPDADILAAFRKYRECGTRPFYAEGDFKDRLLAVLEKSLYFDIPFFLPQITDGNLRLMKAIVGTLAGSAIPRLQVRSLCADWGIGAEKLYQIVNVMESVGILSVIRAEHETKAQSVGAKLFFSDPALYPVLAGNPGTAREALVACLCAASGWTVEASRDERAGDFVLTRTAGGKRKKVTIEIGGTTKSRKEADFVIRDDLDYPAARAIPLWLLGMGY